MKMTQISNHLDGSLILVVEDHTPLLRHIAFLLQVAGFDVMTAHDGAEAMRLMNRAMPALVLTDAEMPGVNGYALLNRLRADRKTAKLPVIMMSEKYDYESLMDALDMGANEYLPKPFDTEQMLDAVYAALGEPVVYFEAL